MTHSQQPNGNSAPSGLRRTVLIVALLNLAYFGVEFAVALSIASVSLFADSVDFLEDASINLIIFFALTFSAQTRSRVGMMLAGILLIPALAAIGAAVQKVQMPIPPDPFALGATGLGALAINLLCAVLLARYRAHSGSLAKAAFLSARNDVAANVAIIAAGFVTATLWRSVFPDLIAGIGIAWLNLDAARAVWRAAKGEYQPES